MCRKQILFFPPPSGLIEWGPEDVAIDFNTSLDSNVFPGFAKWNRRSAALWFLPRLVRARCVELEFMTFVSLQYGVSDRFTVGVTVPYYWQTSKVTASVEHRVRRWVRNAA